MRIFTLFTLLTIPLLSACSHDGTCEDIENREARQQCIDNRNDGTPAPTPIPVAHTYTVEYRVIGTSRTADIVYASTIYGSTELSTGLPWFASLQSNKDKIFVTLYTRAEGGAPLRVQILVDGTLFREASTDGIFTTSVEVSGTVVNPGS